MASKDPDAAGTRATAATEVEPGGGMDISTRLTPRTIRLVALLLVGIAGMVAFWTYFF